MKNIIFLLICYACSQEPKLFRIFGHWTKSLTGSYPTEKNSWPFTELSNSLHFALLAFHNRSSAQLILFDALIIAITWYKIRHFRCVCYTDIRSVFHIWFTRNADNVIFVTLSTYIAISMYHDQASCLSSFKLQCILYMIVLFESL